MRIFQDILVESIFMGLTTINEAMTNVDIHSLNLTIHNSKEYNELISIFNQIDGNDRIRDHLDEYGIKELKKLDEQLSKINNQNEQSLQELPW